MCPPHKLSVTCSTLNEFAEVEQAHAVLGRVVDGFLRADFKGAEGHACLNHILGFAAR